MEENWAENIVDNEHIELLAMTLKAARKGNEIRQLRLGMSDSEARAVISHQSLSELDRLAIKLAQAYRSETGRGPGAYSDSEILWDYRDEDES